ncbi:hypothetical protein AMTR_s00081p00178180 [Amborella trichopoda]|uniref:Uncharacterized protein n=1 Tax=Amborella trichopoda TaxID=13333 RepID=W1PA29_AMBTC|nr:hypothetical protein AMTR_s00081p00178180 [Amborella trichopoda]
MMQQEESSEPCELPTELASHEMALKTRWLMFLPVSRIMVQAKINGERRRDEAPSCHAIVFGATGGLPRMSHAPIFSVKRFPLPPVVRSLTAHTTIMGNHKPALPREKRTILLSHPHVKVSPDLTTRTKGLVIIQRPLLPIFL